MSSDCLDRKVVSSKGTITKNLRWKIKDAVGPCETNNGVDVRQVIGLLNMIGMEFGGTFEFPLPKTGSLTRQLERAISDFQHASMNPLKYPKEEKQRVLPNSHTLKRLNELAGSFGFGGVPTSLPFVRKRILDIAKRERGVVSDKTYADALEVKAYNERFGTAHVFEKGRYRKGMGRLRDYFTNTVTPNVDWGFSGKFTRAKFNKDPFDDTHHDLTVEEGTVLRNMRPPLGSFKTPYRDEKGKATSEGYYNGFHWCGVFTAWVMQQVGMKGVKWSQKKRGLVATKAKDYQSSMHRPGQLVYTDVDIRARRKIVAGQIPLRPGDILVLHGGNNHHVILLDYKITNKQMFSGRFKAIAGNSDYQEVAFEDYPLTKFYRIYHTWP